jgi:uncharacterized protein (UPF0332 family)
MEYHPVKKELIDQYIKMAKERLESAEALIRINNFADSISRSYYAFLDAATAALISVNVAPQSHAAAIALFGKHFVKTKIIPEKFGKMFNKIEKSRLEADYKHLKEFSKTEAEEALKEAREFVRLIEKLLILQ